MRNDAAEETASSPVIKTNLKYLKVGIIRIRSNIYICTLICKWCIYMENENISLLSALHPGQEAVITKVKGYGAFRKRITEMGFVPGVAVKVIKDL